MGRCSDWEMLKDLLQDVSNSKQSYLSQLTDGEFISGQWYSSGAPDALELYPG